MKRYPIVMAGLLCSLAGGWASAPPAAAQTPRLSCARDDQACRQVAGLLTNVRVRRAFDYTDQTDADAFRELIELTQVPAPPFQEAERGRRYVEMLAAAGADSVYTDSIGNVIALRRGLKRDRTVALAGHLDTVFPEGTDVRVQQRGDTLFAPGVADNTRGLIAMLQVLRALVHAGIRTDADLLFIGTVGEEGLGDLRGVKYLFRANGPRINAFIAVDGSNDEEITNAALGSKRYRVTFSGPGGHSWGAFGTANPIHALGRAIRLFDEAAAQFTASGAPTSYNVGRIGGGTSVNSIAFEAWMEVDMRSEDATRLAGIDSLFHIAMVTALNQQNADRARGPELTLEARLVGDRPSGVTASSTPLLQRALAATRAFGLEPRLESSSTDANVPIARGIPAITIGRGGLAGNTHSPNEWWLNANGTRGIRRILLVALAEAGFSQR